MRFKPILCAPGVSSRRRARATAFADDPPKQEELPRRQVTFNWDKNRDRSGLLKASFPYRRSSTKGISDKLASGIRQTMVMRAYVLREGDTNPIALAAGRAASATTSGRDLSHVKIDAAQNDKGIVNLEGVLRQWTGAGSVVADKTLLTKPFFLGVIVR